MKPVVHVFNSSIVSGPETLALPALAVWDRPVRIIFLSESRKEGDSRGPVEYSRGLGLETISITVRRRIDFQTVRDLAQTLRELDPEVVHAHDVKASTYLLQAVRGIRDRKFPIFSTHHGVRGRFGFRNVLYEQYYTHRVLPHYDRVLTVCTSDRELLARRGIDPDLLRVHLNGVDRPLVRLDERAAAAVRLRELWKVSERGIPPGTPILGLLGRLAREKRIDRLLSVCHELHRLDLRLPWAVLIFGRGALEKSLKAQGQRLGLENRVHWMGYRNGVGNELAGFDILLSLSDAEGLPINLVEAGWAATPIFATAVDGNVDLIPAADVGRLVSVTESPAEIAGKLRALLQDADARARIGQAFQARVRSEFSGRRWLADLEKLYEESIKNIGT